MSAQGRPFAASTAIRRNVERDPAQRPARMRAAMDVAVDEGRDMVEPVDRVGEARAAEEGQDFRRLPFDRVDHR